MGKRAEARLHEVRKRFGCPSKIILTAESSAAKTRRLNQSTVETHVNRLRISDISRSATMLAQYDCLKTSTDHLTVDVASRYESSKTPTPRSDSSPGPQKKLTTPVNLRSARSSSSTISQNPISPSPSSLADNPPQPSAPSSLSLPLCSSATSPCFCAGVDES